MSVLEEALGRQIRPDERRSIESLNDLEPRHLEEAALLLRSSRIDAALNLQMLVRRSQLDDVADFLADVVSGGADPKTWRIRDLICVVHVSLPWLTELTVARVKELLAEVEGRRWFRVAARRAQWDDSPFCGAPGVLVERAPYWWSGPDATNYTVAMSSDIELVTDVPTAVRRWLASRIAWELRGERPRSVDAVVSRLRASPPSEDARAAIAALLREDEFLVRYADAVDGFLSDASATYITASEIWQQPGKWGPLPVLCLLPGVDPDAFALAAQPTLRGIDVVVTSSLDAPPPAAAYLGTGETLARLAACGPVPVALRGRIIPIGEVSPSPDVSHALVEGADRIDAVEVEAIARAVSPLVRLLHARAPEPVATS